MKYRLIAIDLDDTLLRDDFTISKRNVEILKKAYDKNIKIVLASGRAIAPIKYYMEKLDIFEPAVAYNGARVIEVKSNKLIYKKEIVVDDAVPILKFAEQSGYSCIIYIDDVAYVEKWNEAVEEYKNFARNVLIKEVGKLSNFVRNDITKIIIQGPHEELLQLKPKAEKIMNNKDLNVYITKPKLLEFTNKYGTKGEALKFLCSYYGISIEESVAIGDSYNDMSMIENSGLGICVRNGYNDVKQKSDYVTLSNEEDGVAHAIEKFVL